MLNNGSFNSVVNSFIGDEEESAAQAEIRELKNEIEKLQKKLENRNHSQREIVVRYIPNEPLTAEIVKGAEFIEPNKPDNVVALIDAAAKLMADSEGVSQAPLTEAMLNALMSAMKFEIFMRKHLN